MESDTTCATRGQSGIIVFPRRKEFSLCDAATNYLPYHEKTLLIRQFSFPEP